VDFVKGGSGVLFSMLVIQLLDFGGDVSPEY
jgi:hypothetical protein